MKTSTLKDSSSSRERCGRTQAIQRIARSHAGTSAMKEMANSPLSGIKVLDLSRVLAGPLVGTLLAYARWGMPFSDQMHQVAEVLAQQFPNTTAIDVTCLY